MTCTIFKFGFSFDAKTYPIPGSYELHLRYDYIPFPVCSVSPAFQRIVQTNHFQETRELDSSISLENVSRTKENFFNNSHIQYLQSEQKSCRQETLNRWTEGLPLAQGQKVYSQYCMSCNSSAAVNVMNSFSWVLQKFNNKNKYFGLRQFVCREQSRHS